MTKSNENGNNNNYRTLISFPAVVAKIPQNVEYMAEQHGIEEHYKAGMPLRGHDGTVYVNKYFYDVPDHLIGKTRTFYVEVQEKLANGKKYRLINLSLQPEGTIGNKELKILPLKNAAKGIAIPGTDQKICFIDKKPYTPKKSKKLQTKKEVVTA